MPTHRTSPGSGRFTHIDPRTGAARMVDVGGKRETSRTARAAARVRVSAATWTAISEGGVKKGDVLAAARFAGIAAAKRTSDLIPLCHPLRLTAVEVEVSLREEEIVDIEATVRAHDRTGVEMEALTAASVAALTVYDMCKSLQRDIEIESVRLLEKTGGKSGPFVNRS